MLIVDKAGIVTTPIPYCGDTDWLPT